jgi:hypothetical protein
MIAKAWEAQRDIRDVMMFPKPWAARVRRKIFRQYGSCPWRWSGEPLPAGNGGRGIVFTADRIAENIGIHATRRSGWRPGSFVLQQLVEEGHVLSRDPLIERCRDILAVEEARVAQALNTLAAGRAWCREEPGAAVEPSAGGDAVSCRRFIAARPSLRNGSESCWKCRGVSRRRMPPGPSHGSRIG